MLKHLLIILHIWHYFHGYNSNHHIIFFCSNIDIKTFNINWILNTKVFKFTWNVRNRLNRKKKKFRFLFCTIQYISHLSCDNTIIFDVKVVTLSIVMSNVNQKRCLFNPCLIELHLSFSLGDHSQRHRSRVRWNILKRM